MGFAQLYLVNFREERSLTKEERGKDAKRGRSSAGRAADLHSAGHRFESVRLHHFKGS